MQTLNEEKAIVGCIQALREATAGEGKVEVIVADGGSADRYVRTY
jgi:glycosyltransferase involved in cell wall biosynthesis